MKFIDWRDRADKPSLKSDEQRRAARYRGRRMSDHVEEMIHEAQERGDFDNLKGAGKPFALEQLRPPDEYSMANSLLKGNDYLPPEIVLQKQIDNELERANQKIQRVIEWRQRLISRRIAPFEREKMAFNTSVEKAAVEYDEALRKINSKILTLILSAPSSMHRPLLKVTELVENFREACPLFRENS
jgi:DnaJ homolog subfamily C member 28